MRIIAGELRGINLYTPKNKKTRPLKDIVRGSIFNLLTHSNKITFQIKKSHILDLYAGTGSFGLECISRSANSVDFVEKEKDATTILEKNIEKLKVKEKTKVHYYDVFKLIKKKNIFDYKFDLIFCDPPYKAHNIDKLIELIFINNLLNKNGILVLHRHLITKEGLPNCYEILDTRTYGISKIVFGKFSY
jgi:16S rRNA (guanine966-N2)-methyltransferase